MTAQNSPDASMRLRQALDAPTPSARLHAAMTAGTRPDATYIEALVERSAVEPDFFVRDMITWALTRHAPEQTVDRLLPELTSPVAQARSQALHTLSKIGDTRAWPAITPALLRDDDPEVARAAWRAAAGLAPHDQHDVLARELATQFGRGDREVRRSLSRALAMLGAAGSTAADEWSTHADPDIRAHAMATAQLIASPDDDFDAAVAEAQRIVALRAAPTVDER